MRVLRVLMFAVLLVAGYGADAAAATATTPKSDVSTAVGAAAAQGSAKPIAMSQQDRMRMCSKQATGKKGAERKTFMKSCLTTKKA